MTLPTLIGTELLFNKVEGNRRVEDWLWKMSAMLEAIPNDGLKIILATGVCVDIAGPLTRLKEFRHLTTWPQFVQVIRDKYEEKVTADEAPVSTDGIRPDPDSCRAIAEMPTPRTAKDVRRFLGAAGYFRRHVEGMLSEVIKYVKTCFSCQRRKGALKVQAPLQEFPEISEPLDRVGADLIDLHCSHSGNQYVLVLVDHLSRYTTLIAIPQKESRTVVREFFHRFVFGPPKVFVLDRGQEFNGHIFKEVCKILETTSAFTTAYHPQANGMTERTNHKDMLAILAEHDANS
nr:uncharacterized protein LOC123763063 [Procambarus clarkii]